MAEEDWGGVYYNLRNSLRHIGKWFHGQAGMLFPKVSLDYYCPDSSSSECLDRSYARLGIETELQPGEKCSFNLEGFRLDSPLILPKDNLSLCLTVMQIFGDYTGEGDFIIRPHSPKEITDRILTPTWKNVVRLRARGQVL